MKKRSRRLIETLLPLKEIGYEASREKYQRKGQIASLHNWWSRKPLVSARLSISASLLNSPKTPEEKSEIITLIKEICSIDIKKKKTALERIKKEICSQRGIKKPKCLDSFAGGGSIPLEALRLGCESYSLDLNPVAYIIQLCTIKYPQEYSKIDKAGSESSESPFFSESPLAKEVKKYGNLINKNLKQKLNIFFTGRKNETILHYLWARTITCPNPSCERVVPLMKNLWLSKKRKLAFKLVDEKETFKLKIENEIDFNPDEGTISQGNLKCPFCDQGADVTYVRKESQEGRVGEYLSAICYLDNNRKKKFREPLAIDLENLKKAKQEYKEMISNHDDLMSLIPDEPAPRKGTGPQRFFSYSNYGFESFDKLFTKRQLLVFGTIITQIHDIYDLLIKKNYDKNYAIAIITYFALILDKMTDLNSNLTSWRASDGGVRNLFDRPTISMKWGYGEINPVSGGSGSWMKLLENICKIIEELSLVADKGANVGLGSATDLQFEDSSFDIISIDPPYYDYIIYSDISDFFYVWLKRSIGKYYPDEFATPLTPKSMEIIHNRHRHNDDEKKSRLFYEDNLRKSFEEIHRVLKDDGITVIMFTHRSTKAWESLLSSIVSSGLMITASWPLRTEMGSRLQTVGRKGQSTVGSTIFLVCKKRDKDATIGYLQEIKEEFTKKIQSKLFKFWNSGVIGSDFFISAIGPGMEDFSRYKQIIDYTGEEVKIESLLKEIRLISTNFIINRLLKGRSAKEIDQISQFYLTFRWAYLDKEVEFDEIRLLSNCFGVDLEKLWGKTGFVKKSALKISILGPSKRKSVKTTNTYVDTMHYAIQLWMNDKRKELEDFLDNNTITHQEDFWQFCQAVAETLLIGNKEKKLVEGFLLSKDRYIRTITSQDKNKKEKDLREFF